MAYACRSRYVKYAFVKGKTYVQQTELKQNITQSMGGQEMKMQVDLSSANEFVVENVLNDGNATMLVSLLNASVHSAGMGKDTTMKFNDLKEKSRIVFSTDGKTVTTTKIDSTAIAGMMGTFDQFAKLALLPGKSVKIGEKWQDKTVENRKASGGSPFDAEVTSNTEYTLVGKEAKDGKEYYKIAFKGTIAINGSGNQMGMEMFLEGTGAVEGFNYFDPKTTMVVYAEGDTEMDMNISISGQQNMTIPMTQSMKTISKFEEKK
ncbi:MAG: hypothetical protein U0Z17_08535 [Bacteroidales bacterium]